MESEESNFGAEQGQMDAGHNSAMDYLSLPELCWARWALQGRSGGAPETSRGRSGEAWGALGELS